MWYGHLLRLPDETSAKGAPKEARKYATRPRGGQKQTWLKLVDKEMEKNMIKVVVNRRVTGEHQVLVS